MDDCTGTPDRSDNGARSDTMTHVGRFTRAAALSVAALALTVGAAGTAGAAGSKAPSVSGTVTAVGGDSTPGTCGTAGATGDFTLTTNGATPTVHTVDVTASTAFVQKKVAAPSFADVCVGYTATAIGVETDFVVDATAVSIHVPKPTHVFGTVTDVNGVSTAGTCGTAGTEGSFTLSTLVSGTPVSTTIFVTPDTKFNVSHVGTSDFSGLCVGYGGQALGLTVGNAILADSVQVKLPKPPTRVHVKGMVTSVNGDATAGTCGTPDTAGTFVVSWTDRTNTVVDTTVVVAASTPFVGRTGVTSFGAVCVGAKSSVIGTNSTDGLDAVSVATYPVKA
jgi:hypothetical protein